MRTLQSPDDLDDAVRDSYTRPIVIFKHSLTCGRSAAAFEEVEELRTFEPEAEVFIVSVQRERAMSNAIAARFKLRHESPQLLVLRDGAVAWHASHYRVTREEIAAALSGS